MRRASCGDAVIGVHRSSPRSIVVHAHAHEAWNLIVRRRGAAALALGLVQLTSTRARAEVVQDYQLWVNMAAERAIEAVDGLRIRLELDSRALNTPRDAPREALPEGEYQNPSATLNVRPEVGYRVDELATLFVGFTYQPQFFWDPRRDDVQEVRLQEEATGHSDLGRMRPGYRTRLEQRYRFTGDGEGEWAHRIRQQLRLDVRPVIDAPWRIRLHDEVMFSLNDTRYATWTGFDRNRAFAGFSYQSSENVQIVAGYLNEFVYRRDELNQLNHAVWVTMEVELKRSSVGRRSDPASAD